MSSPSSLAVTLPDVNVQRKLIEEQADLALNKVQRKLMLEQAGLAVNKVLEESNLALDKIHDEYSRLRAEQDKKSWMQLHEETCANLRKECERLTAEDMEKFDQQLAAVKEEWMRKLVALKEERKKIRAESKARIQVAKAEEAWAGRATETEQAE